MKKAYTIRHWGLTLLLAPFVSQLIVYIFGRYPHEVVGLLEFYPVSIILSLFYSIPTYIIYLICFYFLSKQKVKWSVSKLILIAVSITGIWITQTIIGGVMSKDIIISYSLASLLVGLLLNIKDKP